MTLQSARLAPEGLVDEALLSALGEIGYRARGARTSHETVTWFDTHDGALRRAGWYLARRPAEGAWFLWLDDGTTRSEAGSDDPPDGSGPIGILLSARLRRKPRCPSLRATLDSSRRTVETLTAAPLALVVQRWIFSPPFAPEPNAVSVEVGIDAAAVDPAAGDYLMTLLERRLGLAPAAGNPGARAMELLRLSPAGGPPPLSAVPAADDAIGEAAVRVLHGQAWKMQANRDGALQDVDHEYVHDLRVATRRARFALHLFVDVLGRPLTDEMRGKLAWVTRTLGPLRDVDVFSERLPALLARVDAGPEDSAALVRALRVRRTATRRDVVECLASARWDALVHALSALQPPPPDPVDEAPLTLAAFAYRRVARALARIRLHVGARPEILGPAQLHVLRILFKRLRYTCEYFSSVCDLSALIEASTAFQDQLGRYQDCAAAIGFLSSLPRRVSPWMLGALMQVYRESRARARAKFLRLWKTRGEHLVRWKPPRASPAAR